MDINHWREGIEMMKAVIKNSGSAVRLAACSQLLTYVDGNGA